MIAQLSIQLQKLKDALENFNKAIDTFRKDIRSAERSGVINEAFRGQMLDRLAHMMGTRNHLEQQIDELNLTIQAAKDELNDLLNKLGNCGSI